MRPLSLRRMVLGVAAALIALGMTTPALADTVLAGWDLFQTSTGTEFEGVAFNGVPLGTSYTFPATNPEGNPINPRNPDLGPTDTIIERNQNVTAAPGGSGTTTLTMDALQLVTAAPVAAGTFGPGTLAGNYYITLNPTAASTGTMTINFANPTPGAPPPTQPIGGTFSSTLNLNFDLRYGSLTGTIVSTSSVMLTSTGTDSWSHYPTTGQVLVTNVNSVLNTTDHSNDFFLASPFLEKLPGGFIDVGTTSVPEPSSIVTGGLGLICGVVLIGRWRKRST
jgi:hypothetical protein